MFLWPLKIKLSLHKTRALLVGRNLENAITKAEKKTKIYGSISQVLKIFKSFVAKITQNSLFKSNLLLEMFMY